MTTLFDTVGPAVWRASWQAGMLAILVGMLLGCCGERVTPRWRYLLWTVVVVRLLIVITPGSPWSVFNLTHYGPGNLAANHLAQPAGEDVIDGQPVAAVMPDLSIAVVDVELSQESELGSGRPVANGVVPTKAPAVASSSLLESANESAGTPLFKRRPFSVKRALILTWLVGCVLLIIRLLIANESLRRRLRACRPVADPGVLDMLETMRRRVGAGYSPQLLVTPETVSPYVAGVRRPKIVVPESLLTDGAHDQLDQIFAHELAHVRRGDLWANWFLLAARTLHWFNPLAWWSVHSMQAERESACDEIALNALQGRVRGSYVETIMELASSLAPPPTAPGMIGLFSSRRGLKSRMERILRPPSSRPIGSALLCMLLSLLVLVGLTDALPRGAEEELAEAVPATSPREASEAAVTVEANPALADHKMRGICTDEDDGTPLSGVRVHLLATRGLVGPAERVAEAVTDDEGRFQFVGLNPPMPVSELNRLAYALLATAEGRPAACVGDDLYYLEGREVPILMGRETATLSGKVVDRAGSPLAGATVARYSIRERSILEAGSAVTDAKGEFVITDLPAKQSGGGFYFDEKGEMQIVSRTVSSRPRSPSKVRCAVLHPEHPRAVTDAVTLPGRIECTLPTGAILCGTVTDEVSGKPAAGVSIIAQNLNPGKWALHALTDAEGNYRLAVPQGNFNIRAQTEGRVCVAVTHRECPAGQQIQLPPLKMIPGGLIAGRVMNTATGKPVVMSQRGERIQVALYGPSRPYEKHITSGWMTEVDDDGRFVLRAAPGENFPYLVNEYGSRMAWDTCKQDPVVVVDGQTVETEITFTPKATSEEKMAAAREVLESLPAIGEERVEGILEEFRKLNHTVDETEIWCLLMRELVTIGSDAVPQLCTELDATNEQRMLRRLGVALRAIGDPRSIPALIRAIPKTLQPSMSDFGLRVEDAELATFMQGIDLGNDRGKAFNLGRPVREIFGALRKISKQDFEDDSLFSVTLSDDPHRQVLQRGLYQMQAERWRDWWEAHWQEFANDETARLVNLPAADVATASESPPADSKPRIGTGGVQGQVLSPWHEKGKYVHHFFDLDTGLMPNWPSSIPQEEGAGDTSELAQWAARTGVDLMCVIHRSDDGKVTAALRAFDMRIREISLWDAHNIEKRLESGKFPPGRTADDLLLHYDTQEKKYVPNANGAFLYMTRESGMGMIHVTDRVTRKQNLTGLPAGNPMPGVGFQKGVRFTHRVIVQ